MQKILLIVAAFGMLSLIPDSSAACGRCGIFGRGCRFNSGYNYYYPQYYSQPAYQTQPSTFVFNNTYPVPYLAQQGTTAYGSAVSATQATGYSMAAQPYQVDVGQAFDRQARLAEVAYQGGQEAYTAFNASLVNATAVNDAANRYRSNAAIVAAGLQANALGTGPCQPTVAYTATQVKGVTNQPPPYNNGGGGGGYVPPGQQLPANQYPNYQQPGQPTQLPAQQGFPISYNVCASCHDGLGNHGEPKELVYNGSKPITPEQFGKAAYAVEIGKMPPAHTGVRLGPQDKAIILTELAKMIATNPVPPPGPQPPAEVPPTPPANGYGGGGR